MLDLNTHYPNIQYKGFNKNKMLYTFELNTSNCKDIYTYEAEIINITTYDIKNNIICIYCKIENSIKTLDLPTYFKDSQVIIKWFNNEKQLILDFLENIKDNLYYVYGLEFTKDYLKYRCKIYNIPCNVLFECLYSNIKKLHLIDSTFNFLPSYKLFYIASKLDKDYNFEPNITNDLSIKIIKELYATLLVYNRLKVIENKHY